MPDRSDSSEPGVTEVISHQIRPGRVKDFDAWLQRTLKVKDLSPGYLGTTVIAPRGDEARRRYVVSRFRDQASLDAWQHSPERAKLFEEVNEYAVPHLDNATGLETYFALPGQSSYVPPPRWKITAITLGTSFLISLAAHFALDPLFDPLGLPISTFLFTAILVFLLAYAALPALTRVLAGWLYPASGS